MINKEEAFSITCDNCGDVFEDRSGYSIFFLQSDVHPEDRNWHVDEDKHFCPDCHEIDDNDNVIIKPAPQEDKQ